MTKQSDNDAQVSLLAPCGMDCALCEAHLFGKKRCVGCLGDSALITRKSCINCNKKKCAKERGLTYCFECSDFPCRYIKNMIRPIAKIAATA